MVKQPTFGLGRAQPKSAAVESMDFDQIRLYQTVYQNVCHRLLVGPGYLHHYHFAIHDQNADDGLPSPVVAYEGGYPTSTTSSGVSFNALTDTRDSPDWATRGVLAYASARAFRTWFGSTSDWQ